MYSTPFLSLLRTTRRVCGRTRQCIQGRTDPGVQCFGRAPVCDPGDLFYLSEFGTWSQSEHFMPLTPVAETTAAACFCRRKCRIYQGVEAALERLFGSSPDVHVIFMHMTRQPTGHH